MKLPAALKLIGFCIIIDVFATLKSLAQGNKGKLNTTAASDDRITKSKCPKQVKIQLVPAALE